MTKMLIGEAKYYKHYHKKDNGVNRLLYIPVEVEQFMKLKKNDIIRFIANKHGDVVICKR